MKEDGNRTYLYISVFDWPKNGVVELPVTNKVLKASLLADGRVLKVKKNAAGIGISVPDQAIDAVATVIKIEIAGKFKGNTPSGAKKMKTGALDE